MTSGSDGPDKPPAKEPIRDDAPSPLPREEPHGPATWPKAGDERGTWPPLDGRPHTWPPLGAGTGESAPAMPAVTFDARYVVAREIGRGGMGRVFVAHDQRLSRDVALKVLSSGQHDEEALRRFEQEARAAGTLHHPNILTVFDAGTHAGQPYIISELLTGETLRARIAAGPLPLKLSLELALQLARGLAAAHGKGIVHRDLKPDNLFLDGEGWLKILDFGIAKLLPPPAIPGTPPDQAALGAQPKPEPSVAGKVIGTVGYMAPEQVRGGHIDHRADIFSFGCVLYEMLSGKRAFRGQSAFETTYSILHAEPEPLPESVPQALRLLTARCLAKDPEARPQSARELATELEALLAAHTTSPLLGVVGLPRRRRWLWAALGAAVVICGALWLGLRERGPARSDAPAVAVMPFTVRGSDRFAYLGEGMVDLLSTNLSGGAVRVVDPHSLLRQLQQEKATLDVERARGVARRFSASRVVVGSVLEVERRLRVSAALYDVAGGDALIEVRAEGDAGELFRLVDDITAQLRRRLTPGSPEPEGPGGRLARLGQRMTASADALKAYLEGEQELRRGSWRAALQAFQRAVTLDPEFALAQYRLAVAASLREPGLADDALHRALQHAARLTPRDRALMEAYAAFVAGHAAEAEKRYRAAVVAHPEEVEAWYQLGELLFHFNPVLGRPAAESGEPFGRALVLDPLHGGALIHTIDLAEMQGSRQLALALIDRYLALSDTEAGTRLPMQWTRAWAQGDESGRLFLLDELKREATARDDIYRTLVRSFWQGDDLADARRIATAFADKGGPLLRAEGNEHVAIIDFAQGRPRAARERLRRAAELAPDGTYAVDALWLDGLDVIEVSPEQLLADQRAAAALDEVKLHPGERAQLQGALALRLGDEGALKVALAELEKLPTTVTSLTADAAHALRARQLARRGDAKGALAELDRMKLEIPYQQANNHVRLGLPLLRASLLLQLGRPAEALRYCELASFYNRFEPIYFAARNLCAARAAAKLNQPELARANLRHVIELWRDAEPELKPALLAAQKQLESLPAAK